MSNNLIQNLNCSDVYRTYTLLLTADKDSLETNTTLKQLAGFVCKGILCNGDGIHVCTEKNK